MLASRSAEGLVAFTALLWGTMWLPSRWLDGYADGALWAWLLTFVLPALLLLPLLVRRAGPLLRGGATLWGSAALFAIAFVLYPEALLRGQVARVVLLFHASVVWSTLFGWWFLGEQIGPRRIAAVALGIAGLVALFGFQGGLPLPRSAADWMALGSGLTWSAALTGLRRVPHISDTDKVLATAVLLALVFAAFAFAPGGRGMGVSTGVALLPSVGLAVLLAALWLLPLLWITTHAAARMAPGRLSVVLMLEILVGIVTAALWGDEIPGRRELLGMLFIMTAIGAETLPGWRR